MGEKREGVEATEPSPLIKNLSIFLAPIRTNTQFFQVEEDEWGEGGGNNIRYLCVKKNTT